MDIMAKMIFATRIFVNRTLTGTATDVDSSSTIAIKASMMSMTASTIDAIMPNAANPEPNNASCPVSFELETFQ
ncbi:MAG: hypothetical protein MPL62_15150 [Alphaproteobacteria bacterium]|nr:hypothetical protein [Alphaproteobacteria bacterium]